ncbi:hypothetical protein QNI19_32270 [Cytophagaceae bacterium DM2B3-1]|uniref:Peptidase C51 domain-containing protein n=1 Tax=Xanthocytophaga flava TaxID=3048013 RepID=A0ABT7CXG9_9BACT|nr:hypothetical protein [Xanthocytophaga flavus]MDJ1497660.1 hypothetical protein [Xanthocytophaga flavus]
MKISPFTFLFLSLGTFAQELTEDERKDSLISHFEMPDYQEREFNYDLIEYMIRYGRQLAPTYLEANSRQLMTKVMGHFHDMKRFQQKQINTVTSDDIDLILSNLRQGKEKPEYRGVCYYLEFNRLGYAIADWQELKPGDIVQWWWFSGRQGHCGIIAEVNLEHQWFTIYSSTPEQGFGLKMYLITDDIQFYFARMTRGF